MRMQSKRTRYTELSEIGQGSYGKVFKAKAGGGAVVAIKHLTFRRSHTNATGIPISALREIRVLKRLNHSRDAPENIVRLLDTFVGKGQQGKDLFLVFEYCEHDLGRLLDSLKKPFSESQVKGAIVQVLRAVHFLHQHAIIHRDIKMSNLLYNRRGVIKLCDFGFARSWTNFMTTSRRLTPVVVTLWYRAPEVLLGSEHYGLAVDMWAVGCVLGELVQHRPLLPGQNEAEQMRLMAQLLGAPTEVIWPGWTRLKNAKMLVQAQALGIYTANKLQVKLAHLGAAGIELLNMLLNYDPEFRATAAQALKHPYLTSISPFPTRIMPTFPSTFEQQR